MFRRRQSSFSWETKYPQHILLSALLFLCRVTQFDTPPCFAATQNESTFTNSLPLITTARGVHLLTAEEADRGYPVRIRGVVTFHFTYPDGSKQCFVQDATDGVYIGRPHDASDLAAGELVEVEGASARGMFAPQITEKTMRVIGATPLPKPIDVSLNRIALGIEDCKYGRVRGVVRSAKWTGRLELILAVADGRLRAFVHGWNPTNLTALIDSTVRLYGVVGGNFNQKRQLIAPLFFVGSPTNMVIEEMAAAHPFALPVRSIPSLFQFTPNESYARRVKVRGVVTHQVPGQILYIRDHGHGLAAQTQENVSAEPGDVVEVLGFPAMGPHMPYLQDASFQKIGAEPVPSPIKTSAKEILLGEYDSDLVTVRAQLLDADQHMMVLQAGDILFNAQMDGSSARLRPGSIEKGSELELSGICRVQDVSEATLGRFTPRSFRLLLRSSDDIVLLKSPSWWTARRLLWILAAMAAAILGSLTWVRMLRRKVNQQTEIIRQTVERETILEERTRIARELHDTLAQVFAGVAYQLEAVAESVSNTPDEAKHHLDVALKMVWESSREARRAVMHLRAPLLDKRGLAEALSEALGRLTSSSPIGINFEVTGRSRRLPLEIENNLLRVGQEAVTNTIKHARASRVWIRLHFGNDSVLLTVRDDGCGFDPENPEFDSTEHFGLLGMRERVERTGGMLVLKSAPGQGAEICVELPLALAVSELDHRTVAS